MVLATLLILAALLVVVLTMLWWEHGAHGARFDRLEALLTKKLETQAIPDDLEVIVKHAFAKAGLNTNLAHDVLKHALDEAQMTGIHTFAELRAYLTTHADGR